MRADVWLMLWGCVIWGSVPRPVAAQPDPAVAGQSVPATIPIPPDINDRFLDPDMNPAEWVERFEIESREVFRVRRELMDFAAAKPGDHVADVGAGTGLFTLLLAERVQSSGWVYAVDIAAPFVRRVAELSTVEDADWVTPVVCTEDSVRLPPQSVDLVFICDTYHHFTAPAKTMASIAQAIRPQGRLVVVDFERIPGQSSEWTLGHVRAGKSVVRQEIEAAGFEFVREDAIEGLTENYALEFRKLASP